jgi:hypothetical protein
MSDGSEHYAAEGSEFNQFDISTHFPSAMRGSSEFITATFILHYWYRCEWKATVAANISGRITLWRVSNPFFDSCP